jgi:activator of 2-hydroxyglutaryl-CoA dehydratase
MAEKETKENIIKGLHRGVAERTAGLVERVGLREEVTMTGGVARNTGVVRAIEKALNIKLNVPCEPELTGAFGASVLGLRKLSGEWRDFSGQKCDKRYM